MKKIILSLLLLFFITSNYATNPDIIVIPEKCLVNNSVYVIFQWRAPYNVEDFNVTVFSDAVVFKNSTLHYAGVAEDAKVFYIFEGKAIKSGNHTINVQMKYYINGVTIKKTFLENVTILLLPEITNKNVTNASSEIYNNISTLKNVTNIFTTTNITISKNISKNISENISNIQISNISNNKLNLNKTKNENLTNPNKNKKNNTSLHINNNETSTQGSQNTQNSGWLMYGIFGLILGIVFGFITIYLIKI
ncbi:MAG: hypothetical protein ABGW92_04535 [Methanocaldococcus sp.]